MLKSYRKLDVANFMQLSKTKIVFISFQTLRKPKHIDADVFIIARKKQLAALNQEISSHVPKSQPATPQVPISSRVFYQSIIIAIANSIQKYC
jgi:hypothetical protein